MVLINLRKKYHLFVKELGRVVSINFIVQYMTIKLEKVVTRAAEKKSPEGGARAALKKI